MSRHDFWWLLNKIDTNDSNWGYYFTSGNDEMRSVGWMRHTANYEFGLRHKITGEELIIKEGSTGKPVFDYEGWCRGLYSKWAVQYHNRFIKKGIKYSKLLTR